MSYLSLCVIVNRANTREWRMLKSFKLRPRAKLSYIREISWHVNLTASDARIGWMLSRTAKLPNTGALKVESSFCRVKVFWHSYRHIQPPVFADTALRDRSQCRPETAKSGLSVILLVQNALKLFSGIVILIIFGGFLLFQMR